MPLIKSAQAPTSATPFSMGDIEAHARALLLRANQKAEQLLVAAQAEADAMREQAKAEGMAEGLAAGKRDGVAQGKAEGTAAGQNAAFAAEKTKLTDALAALTAMTAAFDAERDRVIAQAESDVMPLALAIARKLTRRLGEVDPAVFEGNVREAIRLISDPHDLRINVNPDQHELVNELLPRLQAEWPQMKHVAIVNDDAVVAGGCVVRTAGGEIDADLERQLNRLIEELVGTAS